MRFAPILPILVGLFVITSPARAIGPELTLSGGLSIASVSEEPELFGPEYKLGFVGAARVAFGMGPMFAVAPEIGYAMRGFSYGESEAIDRGGNPLGTFETLDATDVITVSLLAQLRPTLAGPVRPTLLVGPTMAFEVSEKIVMTGAIEGHDDADVLKDQDFGVLIGAGLDFAAGPGRLGIEGRYVHGLTDLGRAAIELRTRDFEINATYTIGLLR